MGRKRRNPHAKDGWRQEAGGWDQAETALRTAGLVGTSRGRSERQVELAHSRALISWSEGQDGVVEGRGCKVCGLPGSAAEAALYHEVWGSWQAGRPSRDPINQTRLS